MPLHCRRQQPAQRGQDAPVGPVQARPRVAAPHNRDLVSQHEQLGVPRCRGASKQYEPAGDPGEDQVEQPAAKRSSPASSPRCPFEQQKRWMYNQLLDEPRLTAEHSDITATPNPSSSSSPRRSLAAMVHRHAGPSTPAAAALPSDELASPLRGQINESSSTHRDCVHRLNAPSLVSPDACQWP